MGNLWDDIKKTIREGVDTVVEKTGELTKIGRIKVDILNIKRNVEKSFTELGGKAYHLIVDEKMPQVGGHKEVKEIVECIKLLERELEEKNKDIEKIKTREDKKESSAVKKATTQSSKSKTTKTPAAKRAPAKKTGKSIRKSKTANKK